MSSGGAAIAMAPRISVLNAQDSHASANGGTAPYPIPWLDKNGSHNQPAGPNLEPSQIYDFKGLVGRCSTFTGNGRVKIMNLVGGDRRSPEQGESLYE